MSTLIIRTPVDVEAAQPVNIGTQTIVQYSGRHLDKDLQEEAWGLLSSFHAVEELSVEFCQIYNLPTPWMNVRDLILGSVTFHNQCNVIKLLECCPQLHSLRLTEVLYGDLSQENGQLPAGLRELTVLWRPEEDGRRRYDALFTWMVQNPGKVPDLQRLDLSGIGHDITSDIVLVMDMTRSTLQDVRLGIDPDTHMNDRTNDMLQSYCSTNTIPAHIYMCRSQGEQEDTSVPQNK